MSLILEALRKSEAERRRGAAPDLRVELPPAAAPRRRALPVAAWVTGAVLLAGIAAVMLWPDDTRPDGTVAAAPDRPASAGSGEDAADGTPASDGAGYPAVERIQPEVDLPVPEPAPATVLAPPPMATRAAEEAAAGTPDALDVTAPAAAPPPVRRVPDPTPTEAAPASPATAQRAGAAIPGIAGLATAQRERLPAMKLSMHMWNEDPARRFVVIDGQRRVEGDRVGDATIVAIDRDGVLLDLDGQPVRVPLP